MGLSLAFTIPRNFFRYMTFLGNKDVAPCQRSKNSAINRSKVDMIKSGYNLIASVCNSLREANHFRTQRQIDQKPPLFEKRKMVTFDIGLKRVFFICLATASMIEIVVPLGFANKQTRETTSETQLSPSRPPKVGRVSVR